LVVFYRRHDHADLRTKRNPVDYVMRNLKLSYFDPLCDQGLFGNQDKLFQHSISLDFTRSAVLHPFHNPEPPDRGHHQSLLNLFDVWHRPDNIDCRRNF
jgi:hypothetical protein